MINNTIIFIMAAVALVQIGAANAETPQSAADKRLDLTVTAGGATNTGNTDTLKAKTSVELAHRGERVTSEFSAVYQYEKKNEETSQNRVEFALKELLKTSGPWSPFVTDSFTWDEIKNVAYDNSAGVGVKRLLYSAPGAEISISGLALYQVLRFEGEAKEDNTALAVEPKLKWTHNDLKLTAGLYYHVSTEDTGDYKFNGDLRLTFFVTSTLGLSAEFDSRYRNIVPDDTERLDTTTTFSVTFAY